MEKPKLKTVVYHILDWLLFIGLSVGSVYLMKNGIEEYINSHTFFENTPTKKTFVESPTLIICFAPSYKQSELEKFGIEEMSLLDGITYVDPNFPYTLDEIFDTSTYQIGKDFNLSINAAYMNVDGILDGEYPWKVMYKVGKHNFSISKNTSVSFHIQPVITTHGLCHKVILNATSVGYLYIVFSVWMAPFEIDLPKKATVFVTSEKNSDGVIGLHWYEGARSIIEANFGSDNTPIADLKMEKVTYLAVTSGCSNDMTNYECHIEKFAKADFLKNCSNPCIPFFHQDYANIKNKMDLPICNSPIDNFCMYTLYSKAMYSNINTCPSFCEQISYTTEITEVPRNKKLPNNTAYWTLVFASKDIIEREQNLAYDFLDFVGFVGGTVGLFNGFSFYGFISVPLKYLFNVS